MPNYREAHVRGKGFPKEKSTSVCRREDGTVFHKSEQVKRGEIVPER